MMLPTTSMQTSLSRGSLRLCPVKGQQQIRANAKVGSLQTLQASRKSVIEPAAVLGTTLSMYLLSGLPALASPIPAEGVNNSLIVTGVLFLMSVPGIWSQIKRAPVSKKVRKTFEVEGPGVTGSMATDTYARQIFKYFKTYNYAVTGTGDVITFSGTYASSKGQAAAVSFYTFIGMGCVALVGSTIWPEPLGNWWYSLTGFTIPAYLYYNSKSERVEQIKVKLVTSDTEMTTDIIIEGDAEEIERCRKELVLKEKGMVYVKGMFEKAA